MRALVCKCECARAGAMNVALSVCGVASAPAGALEPFCVDQQSEHPLSTDSQLAGSPPHPKSCAQRKTNIERVFLWGGRARGPALGPAMRSR